MSIQNKKTVVFFNLISTLFTIILIRLFFDSIVYPQETANFFSATRFLHVVLYFFSIFLSFYVVTMFFIKKPSEELFIFLIKAFLFILIIPIVDFFMTGPSPDGLKYIIIKPNEFVKNFFLLMNPYCGNGITFGQHVGAAAIFIAIAFFIFKKTKSFFRSIISIIINYFVLFCYAILPSTILIFYNAKENVNVREKYIDMIKESFLLNKDGDTNFIARYFFQEMISGEVVLLRFYWIFIIVQLIVIFYFVNKNEWKAFFKNARFLRICYWAILILIGFIVNKNIFGDINFANPINFITTVGFFIFTIINIWLAVLINDEEDIEIDKVSNPERPLIKKTITVESWFLLKMLLAGIIFIGIFSFEKMASFPVILVQLIYWIYSMPPLKLKKHFLTSSLSIGFASVLIFMSGFFLVSPDQSMAIFPVKIAILIFVVYGFASNLKDIKDFEGDKLAKINTMPVVFGLNKAKKIVASFFVLIMLGIPIFLNKINLLFFAACFSAFIFYLFVKNKYEEKYIFLTIFLYGSILFLLR